MAERVIVDRAFEEFLGACGLCRYGDFLAATEGLEAIASSRSGRTYRVRLGEGAASIEAYLKIHDYAYWRRLRWRSEKGGLEAANYAMLRDRCGVNVPDVVALGSRTRGARYRDGFILTRAIAGAQSLDAYASAHDGRVGDDVCDRVADVIRRMHAASYFHVDLQWRNILIVADGDADGAGGVDGLAGGPCVYLLDSPRGGLRRTGIGRAHGRIRDLSSLYKDARRWLGPRAQLRWLKHYLGRMRLTSIDRGMIRTILRDRAIKDRTHAA